MKIRDKTPSAILNFPPPTIARIACPACHLEAKKRHGRFKITQQFAMEKRLFVHSDWFSTPAHCLGGFVGFLG